MAVLNINPTRMELTKVKRQLEVAIKGHHLLKDKRDELMRQFLELIREIQELRQKVEGKMMEVNQGFAMASSIMQKEVLVSALMMPSQSVSLDISTKNVMGVSVPVFDISQATDGVSDALSYGYAFTSGDLDQAILTLSALVPDLLLLAQLEKTAQLLAAEIEKTRRRVNALEYIMIPNYQDTIRYITMKLDDYDRSNTTRLMKVKDLMVAKQMETRRQQREQSASESQ